MGTALHTFNIRCGKWVWRWSRGNRWRGDGELGHSLRGFPPHHLQPPFFSQPSQERLFLWQQSYCPPPTSRRSKYNVCFDHFRLLPVFLFYFLVIGTKYIMLGSSYVYFYPKAIVFQKCHFLSPHVKDLRPVIINAFVFPSYAYVLGASSPLF